MHACILSYYGAHAKFWKLCFVCSSFAQIFGQVVSIRVKTLSNTNLVPSRHIRREETLLPIDVRQKAIFNNCFIIHAKCLFLLRSLPLRRTFFKNFGLFLGPVSGYKKMYFLVDTPQTVDNIHSAKCFAYSCISSVQFLIN